MIRIIFSLLISGIIFTACNSSAEKDESVNTDAQPSDQAFVDSTTIQAPADAAPGSTAPLSITAQPTQQGQPAQQINPSATGMNPAHGEPGHRCDIAVGEPLNSPPGNKQAPVITSPMTSTMPVPASAAPPQNAAPPMSPQMAPQMTPQTAPVNVNPAGSQTTTAPGMNPPHGQPGHDCAIAVGAPLKK